MENTKQSTKKTPDNAVRRYAAQEILTGALIGIILALVVVMGIKHFKRSGDGTPVSTSSKMEAQLIREAKLPTDSEGDISNTLPIEADKTIHESLLSDEGPPPITQKQLVEIKNPGIYPEASTRLLAKEEIVGKTTEELQLMRNEIFARRSYIFKTPSVAEYFKRQPWYKAQHASVSSKLSKTEIANIKLIRTFETQKPSTNLRVASHQSKTSTIRFLPPTPEIQESP